MVTMKVGNDIYYVGVNDHQETYGNQCMCKICGCKRSSGRFV